MNNAKIVDGIIAFYDYETGTYGITVGGTPYFKKRAIDIFALGSGLLYIFPKGTAVKLLQIESLPSPNNKNTTGPKANVPSIDFFILGADSRNQFPSIQYSYSQIQNSTPTIFNNIERTGDYEYPGTADEIMPVMTTHRFKIYEGEAALQSEFGGRILVSKNVKMSDRYGNFIDIDGNSDLIYNYSLNKLIETSGTKRNTGRVILENGIVDSKNILEDGGKSISYFNLIPYLPNIFNDQSYYYTLAEDKSLVSEFSSDFHIPTYFSHGVGMKERDFVSVANNTTNVFRSDKVGNITENYDSNVLPLDYIYEGGNGTYVTKNGTIINTSLFSNENSFYNSSNDAILSNITDVRLNAIAGYNIYPFVYNGRHTTISKTGKQTDFYPCSFSVDKVSNYTTRYVNETNETINLEYSQFGTAGVSKEEVFQGSIKSVTGKNEFHISRESLSTGLIINMNGASKYSSLDLPPSSTNYLLYRNEVIPVQDRISFNINKPIQENNSILLIDTLYNNLEYQNNPPEEFIAYFPWNGVSKVENSFGGNVFKIGKKDSAFKRQYLKNGNYTERYQLMIDQYNKIADEKTQSENSEATDLDKILSPNRWQEQKRIEQVNKQPYAYGDLYYRFLKYKLDPDTGEILKAPLKIPRMELKLDENGDPIIDENGQYSVFKYDMDLPVADFDSELENTDKLYLQTISLSKDMQSIRPLNDYNNISLINFEESLLAHTEDTLDISGQSIDAHIDSDVFLRIGKNKVINYETQVDSGTGISVTADLEGGFYSHIGKDSKGNSITSKIDGNVLLNIDRLKLTDEKDLTAEQRKKRKPGMSLNVSSFMGMKIDPKTDSFVLTFKTEPDDPESEDSIKESGLFEININQKVIKQFFGGMKLEFDSSGDSIDKISFTDSSDDNEKDVEFNIKTKNNLDIYFVGEKSTTLNFGKNNSDTDLKFLDGKIQMKDFGSGGSNLDSVVLNDALQSFLSSAFVGGLAGPYPITFPNLAPQASILDTKKSRYIKVT